MSRSHRTRFVTLSAAVIAAACSFGIVVPSALADSTAPRKVVKTADDLPRFTYKVDLKPSELLTADEPFEKLLDAVVVDAEKTLREYDIQDRATQQAYHQFLTSAYFLQGKYDEAIGQSDKAKELETDEVDKLTRGHIGRAWVFAKRESNGDATKFDSLFKTDLERRLRALPLDKVRDDFVRTQMQLRMVNKDLVQQQVTAQLDPAAAALNGTLPDQFAAAIVTMRYALDFAMPIAPTAAEVYDRILADGAAGEKRVDVWTPRLADLTSSGSTLTPVTVAIWDSGVDPACFPKQLWVNAGEIPNNNIDDDKNGFVDDVNGIAFDLDHQPTPSPLLSLQTLTNDKAELLSLVAGSMDMEAAIDSPEAKKLQERVRTLKPEQATPFQEDLGLIGNWAHGTHVAGIAAAGNPAARLMHVRETFDWKQIPQRTPSVESASAWGKSSADAVAYLTKNGAKVVNMSWRYGRSSVEALLALKGVGKDAVERAEMSRSIFNAHRVKLEGAIKGSPGVLFVAGAGNEDNDVDFAEYIPAGLVAPNLITVGAVDERGKPTTFTSMGRNVTLYANGYQIMSKLPGNIDMKFSGTSMAAPQVTNLAAKLLAIDPSLTPAQLVALISEGADPLEGYPDRKLINPAKTVELLKSRKK
jgi:subtilisin family serine protease